MFGFSRKEMNKSCQNVLFQLCQTMKSAPIYGDSLDSHYRIIGTSMEIFGLKVTEITHEGNYVNCELDQTQFPN